MLSFLSINGYILVCFVSVLIAATIYFLIVRFAVPDSVTQDELNQAYKTYEEIKQSEGVEENKVDVIYVNDQGQAVKVTFTEEQWEGYKEERAKHREQMSRQCLN